MKIKALCSFCGRITMAEGETRECSNEYIINDLLKAGYVEAAKEPLPQEQTETHSPKKEPVKTTRKKKAVTKNENQ